MDTLILMVATVFGIEALGVITVICILIWLIRFEAKAYSFNLPKGSTPRSIADHSLGGAVQFKTEDEAEEEKRAKERLQRENEAFSQLMGYNVDQAYGSNIPFKTGVEGGDD